MTSRWAAKEAGRVVGNWYADKDAGSAPLEMYVADALDASRSRWLRIAANHAGRYRDRYKKAEQDLFLEGDIPQAEAFAPAIQAAEQISEALKQLSTKEAGST